MPRLSNTPPKYRRKKVNGSVYAVVTLNGKDFYLGPHGTKTSKQEYDRLIGEWLANGRILPTRQTNRSITLMELCAVYWDFAKGYYVKNGKPTDELPGTKTALRILKETYGKTAVNEFGPISLMAVQDAFVKKGHCRRYVNQNVGRIKRMFKWGVSRELVPIDIYQSLTSVSGLRKGKTKARESAPILPIEDDIVDSTLKQIPYETTKAMIRFQRLYRLPTWGIVRHATGGHRQDGWRLRWGLALLARVPQDGT